MKRLTLMTVAVTALLAVGVADAQRGPGPIGRGPSAGFGLLEFDANGDGRLTRAEFDNGQRARFTSMDGNKDGFVTPEEQRTAMQAEMKARGEAMQKARFAELDTNKNGSLSEAEFLAGLQPKDGDNDRGPRMGRGPGGPPMMMAFGRGGPEGGRMFGPGGPRGPRGPGGPGADGQQPGAPGAPATPAQPRRAGPADADSDGKISFAEFSARGVEAFTKADTDKNGTVTIAELQALPGGRR